MTGSIVSMQPIMSFNCSAGTKCSQTAVANTSVAMLDDQGKCLALLPREGFFDFVIFRTRCDISFPISLVCQHKTKTFAFDNDLSDIKVSAVGGFYSLHAFSSCDAGWFMVDNMCINIYQCQQCNASDIIAHEQCVKHGGYLANRIFKNITITNKFKDYILNHNSSFSMSFWDTVLRESSLSDLNLTKIKKNARTKTMTMTFAVNQSTLCATHSLELCLESKIVLDVTSKYDVFSQRNFRTIIYNGPWSIILRPIFLKANEPNYTLCEKPSININIVTNCSDLYTACHDGTCVHDSLVCDGKPHCLHGEDEANCKHICSDNAASCMSHCHHRDLCSCFPEYFQCLSGGCIPLQKLCDQILHCSDASDEPPTCVYLRPEQLGTPSLSLDIKHYINDLIQKNTPIQLRCFKDELQPVTNVHYTMYAHQPICSPSIRPHDIKFFCNTISPNIRPGLSRCRKESQSTHHFSLDHVCVYDHDCDDEYINHCDDGSHLLKCEHAYCVGRFKCPSSYCISLYHICNKVCDCPHCEDESICSKLLCPGMVLVEQMGSGLKCSRNISSVKHSMNMRQVIHRKDFNITDNFPVFIYLEDRDNITNLILAPEIVVYCQILHSKLYMSEIIPLFRQMPSIRRLMLQHNNIQEVDASMFASMSQLIILDLSHNQIQHLSKFIFCTLYSLQYISLHHNLISTWYGSLFIYAPYIQVLLFESNNIDPQSVTIDVYLPSLYRLSSDIPGICCILETVPVCSPPFTFSISCSNMISSTPQKVLAWIIGLSTSLLNLVCVALLVYHCFTVNKQGIGEIIVFSMNLILAELVASACLLSYSIINVIFQDIFGIIADQWRQSWKCLTLECFFSLSSQASLAFAVCLSVLFAIHIPSLIHKQSSHKAVFSQIVLTWVLFISMCIPVQILEHMQNIDPFNYFYLPFTTSLPSDPLILSIQIVMVIVDFLLVLVCIISYSYLLVFITKQRRDKALKSISKRQKKLMRSALRMTVPILSTSFTWIPVLVVQILVLFQVTISPNTYLWCLMMTLPINLIIDPILLIRNMVV